MGSVLSPLPSAMRSAHALPKQAESLLIAKPHVIRDLARCDVRSVPDDCRYVVIQPWCTLVPHDISCFARHPVEFRSNSQDVAMKETIEERFLEFVDGEGRNRCIDA